MNSKNNIPEDYYESNEDFWDKYRSIDQSGRSMLYRFEHEGVLVYDSHARLSAESIENNLGISQREITLQVKKEISSGNEYGKR